MPAISKPAAVPETSLQTKIKRGQPSGNPVGPSLPPVDATWSRKGKARTCPFYCPQVATAFLNPKGIPSISPALRGTRYAGKSPPLAVQP